MPKHASIACRQLADFVGREAGKRIRIKKKKKKYSKDYIEKAYKDFEFVYPFKSIH